MEKYIVNKSWADTELVYANYIPIYTKLKMATRSTINLKLSNGSYRHIYCHWDGYLDGVGITLLNYYNTEEKINELMDDGDISSLTGTIDKTEFYKNRGEVDIDARIQEYNEIQLESYNYFFIEGKWHYFENERRDELIQFTKKQILFGDD